MNLEKELLKEKKEMETLATFVHGSLFSLHALGIAYNLKKKNYLDVGIHALASIYDLGATIKHYRDSKWK